MPHSPSRPFTTGSFEPKIGVHPGVPGWLYSRAQEFRLASDAVPKTWTTPLTISHGIGEVISAIAGVLSSSMSIDVEALLPQMSVVVTRSS